MKKKVRIFKNYKYKPQKMRDCVMFVRMNLNKAYKRKKPSINSN